MRRRLPDELATILSQNLIHLLCYQDYCAAFEVLDAPCTARAIEVHGHRHAFRPFVYLARALRRGMYPALDRLDFSRSNIDPRAYQCICQALVRRGAIQPPQSRLTYLDLSGGRLDESELKVRSVAQLLQQGLLHDVVHLSVGGSKMARHGLQELAAALSHDPPPRLAYLDLSAAPLCLQALRREHGDDGVLVSSAVSQHYEQLGDAMLLAAPLLASTLARLPYLTHLDLSHQRMDVGGEAISNALRRQHAPLLQTLRLDRAHLSDVDMEALAPALSALSHLRHLSLQLNDLHARGAYALSTCLRRCTALCVVDLRGNSIGDDGLEALLAATPAPTPLTCLDVHDNGITPLGLLSLLTHLDKGWGGGLTDLYLSRNPLGPAHPLLSRLLTRLPPTLRLLHLGGTRHADGLQGLTADLATLPALQDLDLCGLRLPGPVLQRLLATPHHCLRRLRLSRTGLKHDGTLALVDCLQLGHLPCLGELSLADNGLQSGHAIALARGFGNNVCPRFKRLDVSRNKIGDAGAKALAHSLKANCPLQELNLAENREISDKTHKGIQRWLGAVPPTGEIKPGQYLVPQ